MMTRLNKKSRMKREFHVRFCERFGVKFRLTYSTIAQIQSQGDTFFSSTDTAYLIFLLIGIVGYFCVPTVANFVVHAHGGNGMLQRINSLTTGGINRVTSGALNGGAALGGRMEQGRSNILNAPSDFMKGWNSAGSGNTYQQDKLKGDNK